MCLLAFTKAKWNMRQRCTHTHTRVYIFWNSFYSVIQWNSETAFSQWIICKHTQRTLKWITQNVKWQMFPFFSRTHTQHIMQIIDDGHENTFHQYATGCICSKSFEWIWRNWIGNNNKLMTKRKLKMKWINSSFLEKLGRMFNLAIFHWMIFRS